MKSFLLCSQGASDRFRCIFHPTDCTQTLCFKLILVQIHFYAVFTIIVVAYHRKKEQHKPNYKM